MSSYHLILFPLSLRRSKEYYQKETRFWSIWSKDRASIGRNKRIRKRLQSVRYIFVTHRTHLTISSETFCWAGCLCWKKNFHHAPDLTGKIQMKKSSSRNHGPPHHVELTLSNLTVYFPIFVGKWKAK